MPIRPSPYFRPAPRVTSPSVSSSEAMIPPVEWHAPNERLASLGRSAAFGAALVGCSSRLLDYLATSPGRTQEASRPTLLGRRSLSGQDGRITVDGEPGRVSAGSA